MLRVSIAGINGGSFADDADAVWTADFLDFVAKEKLFGPLRRLRVTPTGAGHGCPQRGAQPRCSVAMALACWYAEQVSKISASVRSGRATTRTPSAEPQPIAEGQVMAFALFERKHGADIYNTDMGLHADRARQRHARSCYVVTSRPWFRCSPAAPISKAPTCSSPTAATTVTDCSATCSAPADVCQHLPAEELPGARRGPLHTGPEGFRRRSTRATRQVRMSATAASGWSRLLLRGHHAREQPDPLRPPRHRLSARVNDFVDAYARLRYGDEACSATTPVDYFRSAGPDDRRYLLLIR